MGDEAVTKAMGEIRSGASSRRHGDTLPHIHKVGSPPKQTLFQEIKDSVAETFFHDKPLHKFKDQSGFRIFVLALQSLFPIFEWGKDYTFKKFRGDFISGLTIASLCIPQVKFHSPKLSRHKRVWNWNALFNDNFLTCVCMHDRTLHTQSLLIWNHNMHCVRILIYFEKNFWHLTVSWHGFSFAVRRHKFRGSSCVCFHGKLKRYCNWASSGCVPLAWDYAVRWNQRHPQPWLPASCIHCHILCRSHSNGTWCS